MNLNYKQKIQIGNNVSSIMRLPCVRAAEKQPDGSIRYILYGGAFATKGDWLLQRNDENWIVIKT